MTFEFIIVHSQNDDEPILGVLQERLKEVLESNLNDFDDEAMAHMVSINFSRALPSKSDGSYRAEMGITLELPDGKTKAARDVVDEYTDALMAEPIMHVVKCEDPLLQSELAERAQELFGLEMKLRRVLSIIYLHAYPDANHYDLLSEEAVQRMAAAKPQEDQMRSAGENQFFHLTFSQYVGLNQRPAIKDLVSLIRNEETYEAFRAELLRQPVQHEDDAVFLASLKDRMDAIERMRNAVAHNRRPSKKTTEHYENSLPLVTQALDDYLAALVADWRDDDEWPWESEARQAVEFAMANADWDLAARTITIPSRHDLEYDFVANNEDELTQCLCEIATNVFYDNAPKPDGDFSFDTYGDEFVVPVLEEYRARLFEIWHD